MLLTSCCHHAPDPRVSRTRGSILGSPGPGAKVFYGHALNPGISRPGSKGVQVKGLNPRMSWFELKGFRGQWLNLGISLPGSTGLWHQQLNPGVSRPGYKGLQGKFQARDIQAFIYGSLGPRAQSIGLNPRISRAKDSILGPPGLDLKSCYFVS